MTAVLFHREPHAQLFHGDAVDVLGELPDESAQCCVTSPPYWRLRDYGVEGQIGQEATPDEYVTRLMEVFREVRRVLASNGVLWLNLGDSYAGSWGAQGRQGKTGQLANRSATSARQIAAAARRESGTGSLALMSGLKAKDLVGIPWRVALALQADGWWLRSDVIWSKPNPTPESVTDRPTKAHEYVFLLAKSESYFYDAESIREPDVGAPAGSGFTGGQRGSARVGNLQGGVGTGDRWRPEGGRNARSVWTIPTAPSGVEHYAAMSPELARRCIVSGSRPGDVVIDPFNGVGTTGMVAIREGRRYVGGDLNADYLRSTLDRWSDKAAQPSLWVAGDGT